VVTKVVVVELQLLEPVVFVMALARKKHSVSVWMTEEHFREEELFAILIRVMLQERVAMKTVVAL
jgi:hypothetical protein